jgi:hypothetical protein
MHGTVVNSFWHGNELPSNSWLSLQSFINNGFKFLLYVYDDLKVPEGVELRDARDVLPHSRIFVYQTGPGAGSVAAFANLFRYKLLMEKGGWWVDSDVLCLQPSLPDEGVVFGWQDEALLGNAILRFPQQHSLAVKLYHTAEAIVRTRGDELQWGEIGPNLLTATVKAFGAENFARPVRDFYPLPFWEFERALDPDAVEAVKDQVKNSLCFHLWGEMHRRAGIAIGASPPAGSYLALMSEKHGLQVNT